MLRADDKTSAAVERTMLILEAIAGRTSGLTNSEICRKVNIPKSTASYVLRTLERTRYVTRDRVTGKYHLGLKLLVLSRGVQIGTEVRKSAAPVLRSVVQQTGLTGHIAVLDHGEVVYIEKIDAPGFIKLDTWVGRRMDLHSTSVGKVLAAFMRPSDLELAIPEGGLRRRTGRTITSRGDLIRELRRVREAGYAVDDEENSFGVRCVAAPIFDAQARARAALGLSGTTLEIDQRSIKSVCHLVVEAAARISRDLGYIPPSGKSGSISLWEPGSF